MLVSSLLKRDLLKGHLSHAYAMPASVSPGDTMGSWGYLVSTFEVFLVQ